MPEQQRIERRFVEFRAVDDRFVTGVAIKYGRASNLGPFKETILAGAFAPIGELRLNIMHTRERAIACNRPGGGLVLIDTATELRAEVELPTYGEGPAVAELIQRQVLKGFSIELSVKKDVWEGRSRLVQRAALVGLALVDIPGHEASLLDLERRFSELQPAPGVAPSRGVRYWL